MPQIITVNKVKLIDKIKENLVAHQAEFKEAVESFRLQAKEELQKAAGLIAEGVLRLNVHLEPPQDKTEEYERLIRMYEWELAESIELTIAEYNTVIEDRSDFAMRAKIINQSYTTRGK